MTPASNPLVSGSVPVYNVALPVLRTLGDTPYRVFEI